MKIKKMSYRQWVGSPRRIAEGKVLIEIETVPPHMRMDYQTRNKNVEDKKKLCERCNGTGNELFSMFSLCTKCNGKGHK